MSFRIPEQPAFYKHTTEPSDYWSVGLHAVYNENYELLIENHEEYEYPVDGWEYHVTPPQAYLDWVEAHTPPDDVLEPPM